MAGSREYSKLTSWIAISAVAAGGALGALSRFGIGEAFRLATRLEGWAAVFAANAVGTCLLAVLGAALSVGYWTPHDPAVWAFAATGYCGALTTYSAFGLDTVLLWYEGRRMLALAQMSATLVVGLAVVEAVRRAWGAPA